jgi:hypothetical protein
MASSVLRMSSIAIGPSRDAPLAQHLLELLVLLHRTLDPQHVVEQELVLVGRRQPLERQLRLVQEDLAQPPDLGIDVECHLCGIPSGRPDVTRVTWATLCDGPRTLGFDTSAGAAGGTRVVAGSAWYCVSRPTPF